MLDYKPLVITFIQQVLHYAVMGQHRIVQAPQKSQRFEIERSASNQNGVVIRPRQCENGSRTQLWNKLLMEICMVNTRIAGLRVRVISVVPRDRVEFPSKRPQGLSFPRDPCKLRSRCQNEVWLSRSGVVLDSGLCSLGICCSLGA